MVDLDFDCVFALAAVLVFAAGLALEAAFAAVLVFAFDFGAGFAAALLFAAGFGLAALVVLEAALGFGAVLALGASAFSGGAFGLSGDFVSCFTSAGFSVGS